MTALEASPTPCDCAQRIEYRLGRTDEYRRAKTILNRARFPTFVGRASVHRWASNGGLIFGVVDDVDVAVAMVNTRNDSWQVIAVMPEHQGHGIGDAFTRYLMCSWIRSTESQVPFFERRGYVRIGESMPGRSLSVQLLMRAHLLDVPHRLAEREARCSCHLIEREHAVHEHDDDEPIGQ